MIKFVNLNVNVHIFFSFNKCPIYTHDGANAKFSTNLREMDYSYSVSKNFCIFKNRPGGKNKLQYKVGR
jgi:hypothetical protein